MRSSFFLAAVLLLTACTSAPQVVVQKELVHPKVAPELLQPEPEPVPAPGDMQSVAAGLIEDLRGALRRADAKIEAIGKALQP